MTNERTGVVAQEVRTPDLDHGFSELDEPEIWTTYPKNPEFCAALTGGVK